MAANDEYNRLAYKRGIIEWEIRMLLEQLVNSEENAPQQLVCESVFYSDRITPQEHLINRVSELRTVVATIEQQLAKFTIQQVRHDPDPAESEGSRSEHAARPAARRARPTS